MQGPAEVNAAAVGGVQYLKNNDGFFEIPETHVLAMRANGFFPVDPSYSGDKSSLASVRAIDNLIIPSAVANMQAHQQVNRAMVLDDLSNAEQVNKANIIVDENPSVRSLEVIPSEPKLTCPFIDFSEKEMLQVKKIFEKTSALDDAQNQDLILKIQNITLNNQEWGLTELSAEQVVKLADILDKKPTLDLRDKVIKALD